VNSRKCINKYVKRIGREANLDLSLDTFNGYCYIPFRKFIIMISVPEDAPDQLEFHTMVFDLSATRGESRARKRVSDMQLRGICVGRTKSSVKLYGDEVHLLNSCPIRGLRYSEMVSYLDDFMDTALNINSDLTALDR
jgi:hypothetical protein